jgi:hypothetical protein
LENNNYLLFYSYYNLFLTITILYIINNKAFNLVKGIINSNYITKRTLGLVDIIIIGEPLGESYIYLYL